MILVQERKKLKCIVNVQTLTTTERIHGFVKRPKNSTSFVRDSIATMKGCSTKNVAVGGGVKGYLALVFTN